MDRINDLVREEFVRRLGTLSSVRRSDVASDADADAATDAFRWLRNHSSRLDADDKRQLLESGLVDTCLWFCDRYLSQSPLGRSVLMQFLANLSANDKNARLQIYQGFRHTLRWWLFLITFLRSLTLSFQCRVSAIQNLRVDKYKISPPPIGILGCFF